MSEAFHFPALSEEHSQRILIEASAGTGKTYTLERIILYYLLSPKLRFSLSEILVVTFTRKATREIRGRLRGLIKSCLDDKNAAEKLFRELGIDNRNIDEDTGSSWRSHLARELRSFAHAPVYTIHGFCQAVMTKYPLEAGTLYGTKLDQSVTVEACTDLVRKVLSGSRLDAAPGDPPGTQPIEGTMLALTIESARSVFRRTDSFELFETLARHIESGLFQTGRYLYPPPGSAGVAALWRLLSANHPREIGMILAGGELDGEAYAALAETIEHAEPELLTSSGAPDEDVEDNTKSTSDSRHEKISDIVRRCAAFELLRRLSGLYEQYKSSHARHQTRLNYDDLVATVAKGMAGHPELVERLRQDYKAVLIDEFQDTDGAQWEIFSRIAQDRLIAVGDPKQAIYAFRGADLNTYLRAHGHFDRHFILETNYRSSARLLNATNRMFDTVFSRGAALGSRNVEFSPVKPGNTATETWRVQGPGGTTMPVLRFIRLEAQSAEGIGKARRALIDAICRQIAEFGNGNFNLHPASGHGSNAARPVSWSDHAVLVQSNADARAVSESLGAIGIPSTLLGQAKLMETLEADEIAAFLEAVERPWDSSAVHLALLTRIFGFSVETLDRILINGEVADYTERFFSWHRTYAYKGLHRIFAEASENTFQKLADREGGRFLRTHTNYNHIVDLTAGEFALAEVPAARLGEAFATLRFTRFREDEPALRIDRDSAAVRVMTMHSSKGLEFPIVHVLGGLVARGAKTKGPQYRPFNVTNVEQNGSTYRGFDPYMSEAGTASEQAVLWDEWLRLFYVAATRAQAMLCLPWTGEAGRSLQETNIFTLYHSKAIDPEQLIADLGPDCDVISSGTPGEFLVKKAADQPAGKATPGADFQSGGVARQTPLALRQELPSIPRAGWNHVLYPPTERQSSFTSIVSSIHTAELQRVSSDPGFELKTSRDSAQDEIPAPEIAQQTIPEPAGADFGTLFHLAMEHVDFSAADIEKEILRVIAEIVVPRSSGMRFGQNFPNFASIRHMFTTIVRNAATMRLPDNTYVAKLPAGDIFRELVFNARVPASVQIDGLAGLETLGSFRLGAGYITGSIDMTFRAHDRWHVIDWKTNLIPEGREPGFVMDDNGYKLQALIYQSALHQSLCAQHGIAWDPRSGAGEKDARNLFDKLLGKVWYVFVREFQRNRPVFDATSGWEAVRDFQKQGALYSRG